MDGRQRRGIQQLHDRWLQSRGGDCAARTRGGADIREGCGDGAHLAGHESPELQGRTNHDAEDALGTDHEGCEVEPCDALDRAMAEVQESAVCEDDIDAEDGIPHHAVLGAQ